MVGMTPMRERARERIAEPRAASTEIVASISTRRARATSVFARRRQQHAPPVALEEPHAERPLELRRAAR